MQKNGKNKLSKQIIRVWFDTVLNPIFEELAEIERLLKDNELTWDWNLMDFIEINEFRQLFDFRYQINYEQLTSSEFPELEKFQIKYDENRKRLKLACIRLFNLLVNSNEYNSLVNGIIDKHFDNEKIDPESFNFLKKSNTSAWIASFLINNNHELYPGNKLYPIWKNDSDSFFAYLENDSIRPVFNEFQKTLLEFKSLVKIGIERIKDKMYELSFNYGVPIVEAEKVR
jgi:hypothetical protein